ncbi:MAG: hypothetical protein A2Y33_16675 [Spirochaetes bacterium GWF1_51_8]|nr:MAG: hypothetical protein A2Y33_16675 [Spirochaetes bacterium GWF1_51_8]
MKLTADCHMHSQFSCDSDEPIDSLCSAAVAMGLNVIAVTDHVDYYRNDHCYDYFRPFEYFEAIEAARKKYDGQLKILSGIEFSEPYRYAEEWKAYAGIKFDFMMGSVHQVAGYFISESLLLDKYGVEGVYEQYFAAMLENVRAGGFDTLAHLDFPKRYIPKIDHIPYLEDILRELVRNNIALEINTSSLRKGMDETIPSAETLRAYRAMGGKRVTLGSDAHKAKDIATGFEAAGKMLDVIGGLTPGYFEKRRFIQEI